MSALKGKVAGFEIEWLKAPRGQSGSASVRITAQGQQQVLEVHWRRDRDGIWLETPRGVFGYDATAERTEDGRRTLGLRQRGRDSFWNELEFARGSESAQGGAGAAKKGPVRVRAQMPGKIIRIHVGEGATVEKGQSIAVIEAMKMENEIKSPQSGRVKAVKVKEGQAVETGADLFAIEPVEG